MLRLLYLKSILLFSMGTVFANSPISNGLSITWPTERTVFQRNLSDQANVSFAAQYTKSSTAGYSAQYRIQLLTLDLGIATGSPTAWNNVNFNNTIGSFRTLIGTISNLSKGWYELQIQIIDVNNIQKAYQKIKFGVGDVFLIAGQSNSQGFEGILLNALSQDPRVIAYYRDGYDVLPDAVNIDTLSVVAGIGIVPTRRGIRRQSFRDFAKLKQNGNRMFPNGIDSWCYAVLGKEIQAITNAPITFFNAGASGSDVENWTESIPQNPITKGTTHFRFDIPFGPNDLFGNFPTTPYVPFRNTLQMFGSIMGIRAVLWHQGETDSELKRPSVYPSQDFNYYQNALQTLIAQSRSDFKDANNNNQNSLSWFVSKVSFWRSYYDNITNVWNDQINANLKSKQTAVANNNNHGADTDGISMFSHPFFPDDTTRAVGSYNVHYSNYGLKMLADKWLSSQPWTGNPISGKPLLPITVTQSGSIVNGANSFNFTAPAGYAKYFWVISGDILTNYVGDTRTLSDIALFGNQTIMCYVSKSSDPNEMNFFACQPVRGGSINSIAYPDFLSFDSPDGDFVTTPTPIDQKAYNVVNGTNFIKNNGTKVNYQAGKAIILENGFKAENGTTFKAEIVTFANLPTLSWFSNNIGSGSGSSTLSNGILSINGNGALGGYTDNIHFYNATYSGNVTIIARIDAMSATNGHRAGIMIRNSTSNDSGFYEFIIDGNGNVGKIKRKNAGNNAEFVASAQCPLSSSWLKIVKVGNTIDYAIKPNDTSDWLPVVGWDVHSDNNFNNNYQIGFVAYNGASAIFSNISVNGIAVN